MKSRKPFKAGERARAYGRFSSADLFGPAAVVTVTQDEDSSGHVYVAFKGIGGLVHRRQLVRLVKKPLRTWVIMGGGVLTGPVLPLGERVRVREVRK